MSAPVTAFKIPPGYVEINTVVNICSPWIALWSGDEWGESMRDLKGACHTSYGFVDEDCALFAERLYAYLLAQKEWVDAEGEGLGMWEPEPVARTQAEARKRRDYWAKGGNLGDWADGPAKAQAMIAQMPDWLFGDEK